jgi:hypothetical protein
MSIAFRSSVLDFTFNNRELPSEKIRKIITCVKIMLAE